MLSKSDGRSINMSNDHVKRRLTLVAGGEIMSPSVIGLKPIKVGKAIGNIDENHEESLAVTAGHENKNGGERGIRTPGTAFDRTTV